MGSRIQILAITASILVILLVIFLVRQRKLREEYCIIWIIGSLSLIVFSIWRGLLDIIGNLVGVYYAPAFLLLVGIMFGALGFLHLMVVISTHTDQNKNMAQEIALLKGKLEELTARREPSG
ncbi:MAG: DUF2304 domain-containing protein [Candidatus Zixiibacteriota bacterium]|nr:MAG: DUF2304 domain-containing protein [candidate division Zixibacteria bacterium]